MIRIGDVWDSTVDAARGRAGVIAPIAAIAFFLPGLVQNAVAAFATPGTGASALTLLIVVATLVLTVWGQLAIIAIVTDPATTREDAMRQATRRIGPALANGVALGVILMVVLLPFVVALALAGIDWGAMQGPRPDGMRAMAGASSAAVLFAFLYLLGFIVFSIWFGARVMLTYAVALNERRGLGAIGRSIAITKGATLKLIGVLILYGIVLVVAMFAAQAVMAIPVRVIAGNAAAALFIGSVAAGIVSTVLVALFCVFTGRLYVAAAGTPAKNY